MQYQSVEQLFFVYVDECDFVAFLSICHMDKPHGQTKCLFNLY